MKNWQIIGFLGILVIGFLLISGCSSTGPTTITSQPTVTSTEAIVSTAVPTTAVPTIPASTIPGSTATRFYSTNEINKHFIDIAFDPDNAYIDKWTSDFVDIGISGAYTDADIIMVNNFSEVFNRYSSVKLLEVKRERTTANVVLKLMPESALKDVNSDDSLKIFKNRETGDIIFIYKQTPDTPNSETVLINSDLKADARTHWILRALLYELGFRGETGTIPDSIFFSDSETTTSLSKIDLKVVELLYGKKIYNGMRLTDIQDTLLL